MGDWATIAGWNVAALRAVGDDLSTQLKRLRGTEAELRDAVTPREWDGPAAEAAKRSLDGLERGVLHRAEEYAMLRAAVDDAADRTDHLHAAMKSAAEFARANDFMITDGTVSPRADARSQGPGQGSPSLNPDVRAHLEAQVEQIIRTGLDIDADLTAVMLSVADGKGWSEASTLTEAASTGSEWGQSTVVEAPKNASPAQNKAWWDSLSADERKWLIAHKPETIGNRKGIPYEARHDANVNRLTSERTRLQELHTKMRDEDYVLERIKEVGANQFLKELHGIEAKLDAIDVLDIQAKNNSIITFDPSGERVRAAVAIGDIDNADYLTVHTPGMNSAVETNMNRYVDEFSETTEHAGRMLDGTGDTAATVVWMDYLPPKADIEEGLGGLSDDRAEEGAKRLAAELEGIQASRLDDPPERLTATGHSYGSLTTALALRQSDAADAFVSQGSPGWGDDAGSGLKVPQNELYNMRTHDDFLVAELGWHGGSPEGYEGVRQLGTQGAVTSDGASLSGSEGHSGYTVANDEMSTSEYNTAAVMVGRDELLIDRPVRPEHSDTR